MCDRERETQKLKRTNSAPKSTRLADSYFYSLLAASRFTEKSKFLEREKMSEKIEDLNLPNAVVTRIIKEAVPKGTMISKVVLVSKLFLQ